MYTNLFCKAIVKTGFSPGSGEVIRRGFGVDTQNMVGHLIRRLHQKSTQVFTKRAKETGVDLTSVQFAAMVAICSNPGIDQAHVAALIAYDKATIGGVIDRLEQKGLISKRVNQRDRRAREVTLTVAGQNLLRSFAPVVDALQDEILSGLNKGERDAFFVLAKKAAIPEAG